MATARKKTVGALRTRWAAVGAAIAVTLGAGVGSGVLTIQAAPNDESDVVTVTPARIVDTRTGVGIADGLESGTAYGLRVTGTVATTTGNVEVVPQFATGVLLNVTVVRPTSSGFLSVVPGTFEQGPYATSSLNFLAGANTPNAVTVSLPALGDFSPSDIRTGSINLRFDGAPGATTDVLVDVVGYLTESVVIDHTRRLSILEATSPVTAAFGESGASAPLSGQRVVESVTIPTSKTGTLVVNSTVTLFQPSGSSGSAVCEITMGTTFSGIASQSMPIVSGEVSNLSGTRGFMVPGSVTPATVNLVCSSSGPNVSAFGGILTAVFSPTDPETFAGG